MGRTVRRLKRATKRAANSAVGVVTIALLKLLRLTNPDTMGNISGRFMQTVGPLLPENRIGRANLTAAFPEKSATEIDTILGGVWDNLGRIAAEFAHLDRLSDFDPWHPERSARIEARQADLDRFFKVLEQPKPAIVFGAHFGNWELPAVCAAACKLDTAVLYRRPNNPAIDKCVFVVDRKDLDRQTREEFNRFQEGCVEENTNTGALVRRLLFDYLTAYLQTGNAALIEYHDGGKAVRLADEYRSLLEQSQFLADYAPEFYKYLEELPKASSPNIEEFIYWSKEKFGLKPVISVTHASIYRNPGSGRTLIASKQIYASHYFEASLGLTAVVGSLQQSEPCFYLLYLNRSRSDALHGGFSGLARGQERQPSPLVLVPDGPPSRQELPGTQPEAGPEVALVVEAADLRRGRNLKLRRSRQHDHLPRAGVRIVVLRGRGRRDRASTQGSRRPADRSTCPDPRTAA